MSNWFTVLTMVFMLSSCARRYLLVMTSSMLDCPQDKISVKNIKDIQWSVEGCSRRAQCQENVWYGTDDWTCKEQANGK